MKWYFSACEPDDRGVNEARGYACEIVAWRFLSHLSEREKIDYLLYELPGGEIESNTLIDPDDGLSQAESQVRRAAEERVPLLRGIAPGTRTLADDQADPTSSFIGLNALEIATVADAKKFLSQKSVQKIITDLWSGHIVFWESLEKHSTKKARIYNKRLADPYCRLRVPKYQKAFEALFFASFLAFYYAVLVERNPSQITVTEVFLAIWLAAFTYDEFSEFRDAGRLFYSTDFWSIWDLGIIGVGFAYLIASGLISESSWRCLTLISDRGDWSRQRGHEDHGRLLRYSLSGSSVLGTSVSIREQLWLRKAVLNPATGYVRS